METTIKTILINNIKEAFKVYGIEGTEDKIKELYKGKTKETALNLYGQVLKKEVWYEDN